MFHQGSGTRGRGSEGAREWPMQKLPTIFEETWGSVRVLKIYKYKI
jgi:hypothetical protein